MIKKVQQDLRAFFFTQDKYISHDKHLTLLLKNSGDDIIIVRLYHQHCHPQWTHVKGKKTIICQIYLLVLSTQCQNTISAELLSYLTVIFLLLKPNILALLSAMKSHNKIPQSMSWNFSGRTCFNVSFPLWLLVNWPCDPLGHHPTLWYILQYELWIDFIYTTTQECEMLNENGIFDLLDEMMLTQNEERQWKPPRPQPGIPLSSLKSKIQIGLAQFSAHQKYPTFVLWISKILFSPLDFKISFIHIFLSPSLL